MGYYVPVPTAEIKTSEPELDEPERRAGLRQITRSPRAFWVVFFVIHVALALSGYFLGGLGDVFWYLSQVQKAVVTGVWPAIDTTFVYPGAALPVILVPAVFGAQLYFTTWMAIVFILNSVAVLAILGWNPRNTQRLWLCWWWAAFILLLGPVAIGRVDAVSVPITIVALTWLWRRPAISGALIALAGWIKIWPIAVFGALFVVLRRRWSILAGAVVFTVGLIVVYMALGAKLSVILGFITSQNDRGIQAEAVAATPFLWIGALGGKAGIVWNSHLLTNEIYGTGAVLVNDLLSPLMVISAAVLCGIAYFARRSGARVRRILPPLMLGLALTLIVFNKVGSPQFMAWLAAPVIVGLVMQQRGFELPARYVLIIALLTQIIFPTFYLFFLWLNPALVIVTSLRNGLLVFLLIWSGVQLVSALRDALRGRTILVVDRYNDLAKSAIKE